MGFIIGRYLQFSLNFRFSVNYQQYRLSSSDQPQKQTNGATVCQRFTHACAKHAPAIATPLPWLTYTPCGCWSMPQTKSAMTSLVPPQTPPRSSAGPFLAAAPEKIRGPERWHRRVRPLCIICCPTKRGTDRSPALRSGRAWLSVAFGPDSHIVIKLKRVSIDTLCLRRAWHDMYKLDPDMVKRPSDLFLNSHTYCCFQTCYDRSNTFPWNDWAMTGGGAPHTQTVAIAMIVLELVSVSFSVKGIAHLVADCLVPLKTVFKWGRELSYYTQEKPGTTLLYRRMQLSAKGLYVKKDAACCNLVISATYFRCISPMYTEARMAQWYRAAASSVNVSSSSHRSPTAFAIPHMMPNLGTEGSYFTTDNNPTIVVHQPGIHMPADSRVMYPNL